MIEIKKGANIDKLHPMMIMALRTIAETTKEVEKNNYVATITSGNDGLHKKDSLHYSNKAVDVRTRDMKNKELVTKELKNKLGKNYDVILEKDHIHIEYDPK